MSSENPLHRQIATHHFQEARRQARREELTAWLRGKGSSSTLLPFEAIRSELPAQTPVYMGVQQIALDKIVGSLGRYREFTRTFLPLSDSLYERWVNVESLAHSRGWPPIEVFEIGGVYFIKDGNHRAAIARQMNNQTIEAHVWSFPEPITIGPDESLDEILIRLGQRNFLRRTQLDQVFPDHDIQFTAPGRYGELLSQIEWLRRVLSQVDEEEMSYQEAVVNWYELIYLPTVQVIRETHLLDEFPGRTEADLFVWLSQHRRQFGEEYGQYETLGDLAQLLADRHRESSLGKMVRQVRKILGTETLPPLSSPGDDATTDEG